MFLAYHPTTQIGKRNLQDRDWVRDLPPQDLLLWRFVGNNNLGFTIGDEWRKHSRVITNIFQGSPPLSNFKAIFDRFEEHFPVSTSPTTVSWDKWTERITLDVLGTTILGHDFQAISNNSSPFLSTYRHVMAHITEPPYVFFPILDKLLPRKELVRSVDTIRSRFQDIINEKQTKSDGGQDLISLMISHPEFTQKDLLDNVTFLFIAGHVRLSISFFS
jgi:cytochrome P450